MMRFYPTARSTRRNGLVSLFPLACLIAVAGPAAAMESEKNGAVTDIVSIRIFPEEPVLWGQDAVQHLVVLAECTDGLERDVSAQCRFSLSDETVARLDESMRLVAMTDGETELQVECGTRKASTIVRVVESQAEQPFSFQRDIGEIFTRRGCNASDCHGGVKGRGGFKLSLNSLNPQNDYNQIVKGGDYQVLTDQVAEERIPRIDLEEPEESLLLLKPTTKAPHKGGKFFEVGSDDYATIVNWIHQGAPFGELESGNTKIARLQVLPQMAVLDTKGERQLIITASLGNGRHRDVTDHARFQSSNEAVAKVGPDGKVKATGSGEANIIVWFPGHFAHARIGVIARPVTDFPEIPHKNFIDDHVFTKQFKLNIIPSALSSDAEFLRRVCLDITGTLPPPERAREFMEDADPQKRAKLIDILLDSSEYVDLWSYRFQDLFRVHFNSQTNIRHTYLYSEWVRNSIAQNKPYNRMAWELIAAEGYGGLTQRFFRLSGLMSPSQLMAEQARVFHGVRLECAECHDHPFESWSQSQFWSLSAFFGRMSVAGNGGIKRKDLFLDDQFTLDFPGDLGVIGWKDVIHPRTKQKVKPAFLDGREMAEGAEAPRKQLADWMTAMENDQFSKATVNRMWGFFLGRGIVDPVDDFRSSNPPSHPKLLDALARDFVEHDYDLKHLVRTIVNSSTYQLTGEATEENLDDTINYSWSRPRPLEASVLLDAISQFTGVPEAFRMNHYMEGGPTPPGTRAIELLPDISSSAFLDEVYGRFDRRAQAPTSNNAIEMTLRQGLHRLVGSVYTEKIGQEGGRIHRLLESNADDARIIEELYLSALCRLPTNVERMELEKMIGEGDSRKNDVEALAWALISSIEFVYNH